MAWLLDGLKRFNATWKVIAADMPISLHLGDGKDADGAPLGRELEIAHLLREIKQARIHNVEWLTTDVHYTAVHYFDLNKVDATFGMKFFGQVDIDAKTKAMTVTLKDPMGAALYSKTLESQRS